MSIFHKRYDINKVNINEVFDLMTNGDYLIDLRSQSEYKEAHLPNSINVPFLKISEWVKKNIKNSNARFFLYCQNGARSVHAAATLRKMGYTNIVDLGGLNAFKGILEK
ncbi:MAG TPA: rhodanese-like domain-containing protein [Clostridia bacterium]